MGNPNGNLRRINQIDNACADGELAWQHFRDALSEHCGEPTADLGNGSTRCAKCKRIFDPLRRRAFVLTTYNNVQIRIPAGQPIEHVTPDSEELGEYDSTELLGVNLHFHGFNGLTTSDAERVVVGNVDVYVEVWEPDWSGLTDAERARRNGWRNYKYKMDITPNLNSDAKLKLLIRDVFANGYSRKSRHITGNGNRFAHRSDDWKEIRGRDQFGRNQDFQFVELGSANKPAAADKGNGASKPKSSRSSDGYTVGHYDDGEATTSMGQALKDANIDPALFAE